MYSPKSTISAEKNTQGKGRAISDSAFALWHLNIGINLHLLYEYVNRNFSGTGPQFEVVL